MPSNIEPRRTRNPTAPSHQKSRALTVSPYGRHRRTVQMTHSEKHVALLALEQQPGIESVAIRLLAPPPLDPQTPKSSQTREQ